MAKRGRKKTKVALRKVDLTAINPEQKAYRKGLYDAMHYAQYQLKDKSLVKEVHDYAKSQKMTAAAIRALKANDDKKLALLGKYCYILNGGGVFEESLQKSFENKLAEYVEVGKAILAERKKEARKAKKETGPQLTVQDRMRLQASDVAAEVNAWVDYLAADPKNKPTDEMDPLKAMQAADFKAGQARWMQKFYKVEVKEFKALLAGKDEDLVEGYSNLNKHQVKRILKLLEDVMTGCKMIITMSKAKRKTNRRKKKAPKIQDQVKGIKYLEASPEHGVASVSPVNIPGAKEVWIFNTKYRKLGRFVAKDAAGLGCKGASIVDYDENRSVQKTLRKPKEQLKELMDAGKVQLRTFLDDIKAVDHKLKGRMNDNIVILKVVK